MPNFEELPKPEELEKPEKPKIFLPILIVLIVIFGIVSFLLIREFVKPTAKISLKNCMQIQNETAKNICILKLAASMNNVGYCENISQIPNDILYYSCKERIWEKMDCSYEWFIKEGLDDCYSQIALSKNNMSYCYMASDSIIRDNCIKNITQIAIAEKDTSLCSVEPECYLGIAIALNDASICEEIPAAHSADCYYQYARVTKDTKACQKITSADYYDWCISFGKTLDEIRDECQKSINTSCFVDYAMKRHEPEICSFADETKKESDLLARDICYEFLAFDFHNSTLCENIISSDFRDLCLAELTVEKNYCDKIISDDFHTMCISLLTKVDNCNEIKNDYLKDSCNKKFKYCIIPKICPIGRS